MLLLVSETLCCCTLTLGTGADPNNFTLKQTIKALQDTHYKAEDDQEWLEFKKDFIK